MLGDTTKNSVTEAAAGRHSWFGMSSHWTVALLVGPKHFLNTAHQEHLAACRTVAGPFAAALAVVAWMAADPPSLITFYPLVSPT